MDLDKLWIEHARMKRELDEWRPLVARLRELLQQQPAPEPPPPPKRSHHKKKPPPDKVARGNYPLAHAEVVE
jgi:hypothetical protein